MLYLFMLALPPVLPLTIPFGVLVGILVGLGRLASDGEITAMRASGVSSRSVAPPVVTFCLGAVFITAAAALSLTPLAIRSEYEIINRLYAELLTAGTQPEETRPTLQRKTPPRDFSPL